MKIVYFGTPEIAVPTLAAIAERHAVAGVVTQPDRPRGRSGKPEPTEVKTWALEHGLEVVQPEKLNDGGFEAWLREKAPEMCVLAAYGRLLKQPILDVPSCGWLNMHPSLLPRWRGPSPIQTAILEGDDVTGVSIMRVIAEMDAGSIVLQERLAVGRCETAGELSGRLADLGAQLVLKALELQAEGAIREVPQDPAQVTFSKMFEKADGRVAWHDSARRIHNRIRACNPWPMAQCLFHGQVLRLLRSDFSEETADAAPGTVVGADKSGIHVAAGEGRLIVTQLQLAGKKPLDADAFLRGTPVKAGELFGEVA